MSYILGTQTVRNHFTLALPAKAAVVALGLRLYRELAMICTPSFEVLPSGARAGWVYDGSLTGQFLIFFSLHSWAKACDAKRNCLAMKIVPTDIFDRL